MVDCKLTDDMAPVITRIMKTHAVRREEWLWSGSFRQSMSYTHGAWSGKGVVPHSKELGTEVPMMGILVMDLRLV